MSDPELLGDTASHNFLGPEGDTVTVDEQLLNTEYCRPARHVPVSATSTRVGVAGNEPAAATYAAHLRCQAPPPRTHAAT